MTLKKIILVALLLLATSCGKSLKDQVRDQVRELSNARLGKEQVSVSNLKKMENTATAELNIHTAVRMKQVDGEWKIEEIRLGDRTWENIHRITAAIEKIRKEDTLNDMKIIRDGIREMVKMNGPLDKEIDFISLIDQLSPRFIGPPIREDAWDNPFILVVTGEGYQIRSTGPDGRPGNNDDLVLNDNLVKQ